jgi:hypothetical protein
VNCKGSDRKLAAKKVLKLGPERKEVTLEWRKLPNK